jgi:alpha-1,6-mannosyltransferase
MIGLTLCYVASVYLVRRDGRRSLTWIIAGGFLAFSLLFLFAPPLNSRDVYSYAYYGRAMTVYHANPYLLLPVSHRADILYPLIGWKYQASVYGPIFSFLSYAIVRLAGNNIAGYVLGFKMLAFASFAGCLVLAYALARRVSPGRQNMALAIAAWSPLLLLHIAGAGHNEMLMVLFVLGGFYACWRGRPYLGLVLVVLAAMVKISAILALAPYLVYYLFRYKRGEFWPRLAGSAAAVIVIPALLYLPFWNGTKIFKSTLHVTKLYSASSVPMLTKTFLGNIFGRIGMSAGTAASLSTRVTYAFFMLLFLSVMVALLLRTRDFRSMAAATAGIALVWFLTTSYILPWYLALGLLVTGIAGWSATTGCLIAASSVFMLYRIPPSNLQTAVTRVTTATGGHPGPTRAISLPLVVILVVWLIYTRPFRRARSEPAPVGGAPALEAADEN